MPMCSDFRGGGPGPAVAAEVWHGAAAMGAAAAMAYGGAWRLALHLITIPAAPLALWLDGPPGRKPCTGFRSVPTTAAPLVSFPLLFASLWWFHPYQRGRSCGFRVKTQAPSERTAATDHRCDLLGGVVLETQTITVRLVRGSWRVSFGVQGCGCRGGGPGRWWLPRQRPRAPMRRRFYGARSLLKWVWVATRMKTARAGSSST